LGNGTSNFGEKMYPILIAITAIAALIAACVEGEMLARPNSNENKADNFVMIMLIITIFIAIIAMKASMKAIITDKLIAIIFIVSQVLQFSVVYGICWWRNRKARSIKPA
jgi:4-amino-4-deoxy-L-arabinose transferase-like glycosyltransferase